MNDINGLVALLTGCSAVSMIFYYLFSDKNKKTDQQVYQETLENKSKQSDR